MEQMKLLQMLVHAAELGSFAAAAKRMEMTPSAVSRGISELERELSATLFNRTTRSLQLTEDGLQVRARAAEILERLTELKGSVAKRRARVGGTVRVGVSAPINRYVVMPRLVSFLERYPEVRLEMNVTQDARSMQADNLDVLMHVGEPPPSRLVATRLAQGQPAVYASPDYMRKHGEPPHPDELVRYRCLVFRPPWLSQAQTQWGFVRANERKLVRVDPVVVSADREGLINAAVAGAGLIYMACFDPALIASGQLRRLLPDWSCEPSFNIYVMHRRTRVLPPQVLAFLKFCREAFATFDPEGRTIVHHDGR
jgi:DNA-binding transcriptional LysR family regulator